VPLPDGDENGVTLGIDPRAVHRACQRRRRSALAWHPTRVVRQQGVTDGRRAWAACGPGPVGEPPATGLAAMACGRLWFCGAGENIAPRVVDVM
jgi:hypothetical protein